MTEASKPRPPSWINRLFWVSALAFLVVIAFSAWQGWNKGHFFAGRPIADIAVNLNGRSVREHCTTCHPGGALPGVTAGKHPNIAPHKVETLGCTGCHLGEGMALDTLISHGLPGLGARKVLQGRALVATCYTCHELQPLEGAEKAWNGYQIFDEKACASCHYIGSLGLGGRYGPDLSRIGSDLGLEKIQEAIRDPKQEPANSTMPRFPLSRGKVKNLSYFLKSRVAHPNHVTPMMSRARESRRAEGIDLIETTSLSGERLLERVRCLACHQYREKDGRVAPDLTFIGSLRDETYLRDFLRAPVKNIPGASMPVIPLPDALEDRLVALLARESVGPLSKNDAKTQYMKLCQRCHAANGDGRGLIQPDLAGFPRAFFNNSDFFRSISDERIERSVEKGLPGTSMPPYGRLLPQKERTALIDLIFKSFIGIDRQDKSLNAAIPERPAEVMPAQGDRLYADLCQRCHGVAGTGTGPEHLNHLPRPRNLGNRPYFAAVQDNQIAGIIYQGTPGTAMPAFGERVSPEDLWSLVDKVRNFSGTNK